MCPFCFTLSMHFFDIKSQNKPSIGLLYFWNNHIAYICFLHKNCCRTYIILIICWLVAFLGHPLHCADNKIWHTSLQKANKNSSSFIALIFLFHPSNNNSLQNSCYLKMVKLWGDSLLAVKCILTFSCNLQGISITAVRLISLSAKTLYLSPYYLSINKHHNYRISFKCLFLDGVIWLSHY